MALSILTRVEREIRGGKSHIARARGAIEQAVSTVSPTVAAILMAVPVVLAALFYVWTHVASVRLGYEISRAGEAHRALIEENRALRVEVASLKDPKRLAALATEKYGLAPPQPSQIIKRGQP